MGLLKLVIVDDEPILLEGLVKTYDWNGMGYEVVGFAQSGEQALKVIREKKPHVVLTDIRMKQISGLMVMEEIKKENPECQFVVLSAYRDFEYAKKACDLGAFAYLLKPIEDEKLQATMTDVGKICEDQIRNEEKYDRWERLLKKDGDGFLQVVVQKYVQNRLPEEKEDEEEEEDDRPKIAVIGKPNAGKSSIINKLLGEERVIVSPVAGTTRDAIDTTVKRNGQEYVFIDTAGLRRKSKIKEELERYSIIRTVTAVERCDVAVLIIDATEGITEQDAKIAGIAHERGKGMIIAVKWDLVEKDNTTMKKFTEKIREKLSYMPYAELIFLSAKTGQRLPKLFEMIDAVIENCALRVQTGVLNEILTEAMAMKQPPSDKGKRLRIYYITQVSVKPPTFVMFINEKKLTHFSYTRYIENQIRTTFGFRGTPIHFIYRERKEK